ncbi:uncharacterized protein KD926_002247 [Aspergillus affinis]|uniref:uncharacterized protein n=1 Tax=Aspergillus affinis TaxID=1070780 RepID=UPI0022FE7F87|nr:uncharacterized protein KD926_002247 [Aspergillus affinis]KAI9036159.1 hypothetical protein KD926_002247 [Aspergillus affinis]
MTATTEPQPLSSLEAYNITALDCVNLPIHVPVAFVFTPVGIPAAVEALERGISRLVAQLPFLAGNVILNPGNGGVVRPPSDKYLEGSPIVCTQVHPKSISVLHEPNFGFNDGISCDYFLPVPISLQTQDRSPVIRFRINVMTDGLILCVSFHHAAMDGLGVMNVIRMVGLCCASHNMPRLPVSCLTEATVRSRVLNITTSGSFMSMEGYGPHHWSHLRLTSCELRFPAKRVHQLGKLCNDILNKLVLEKQASNKDARKMNELSTSDVFSALLWLCGTRARSGVRSQSTSSGASAADTTRLSLAVNIRGIIKPPIPLSYLGNAMVVASDTHARQEMKAPRTTTATAIDHDELRLLTDLASKIRHIIQGVDHEYVCQVMKHIKQSQDRQDASFYFPETFVTNMRLLNLHRWEFGPELGKVVNFDHLDTRINGLCSILPRCQGKFEDPPWKVRVVLEPEAMQRLREDGLIRWAAKEGMPGKL